MTGTTRCNVYRLEHARTQFALIDTPGLDDAPLENMPMLREIARVIACERRGGGQSEPWITGALYFHRITDRRFTGPLRFNFDIFKALCGESLFHSRMACVTTLWDHIRPEKVPAFQRYSDELRKGEMNLTKDKDIGVVFDLKEDGLNVHFDILDHFAKVANKGGRRWLKFEREVTGRDGVKDVQKTEAGRLIKKKASGSLCVIL